MQFVHIVRFINRFVNSNFSRLRSCVVGLDFKLTFPNIQVTYSEHLIWKKQGLWSENNY